MLWQKDGKGKETINTQNKELAILTSHQAKSSSEPKCTQQKNQILYRSISYGTETEVQPVQCIRALVQLEATESPLRSTRLSRAALHQATSPPRRKDNCLPQASLHALAEALSCSECVLMRISVCAECFPLIMKLCCLASVVIRRAESMMTVRSTGSWFLVNVQAYDCLSLWTL